MCNFFLQHLWLSCENLLPHSISIINSSGRTPFVTFTCGGGSGRRCRPVVGGVRWSLIHNPPHPFSCTTWCVLRTEQSSVEEPICSQGQNHFLPSLCFTHTNTAPCWVCQLVKWGRFFSVLICIFLRWAHGLSIYINGMKWEKFFIYLNNLLLNAIYEYC